MTSTPSASTLLTAPTILLGGRGEIVRDGAVLIAGGTIAAAGRRSDIDPALVGPGTVRRHFDSASILPGLVDAHVHLAFAGPPGRIRAMLAQPDNTRLVLQMASHAAEMLHQGVTTVRDLGDRDRLALRLRDAVAAGEVLGPRVLAAGSPLTPPGGHCHFLGGVVSGAAEIHDRVHRLADDGVDVVKVMASGGEMTQGDYAPWESQFTVDELRAAVDAAHARGLRVAAHAHGADSIERAVDAGVDTVEHGGWLIGERNPEPRPAVAARMSAQGTVLCHGSPNDWRRMVSLGVDEAQARRTVARLAWFEEHGVTQINGTDAGVGAFTNTAKALVGLAELGFAHDHLVEIGTRAGAEALGLGDVTGSLRAGLDADVLVVEGDVTTDASALTRPVAVFRQGASVALPQRIDAP